MSNRLRLTFYSLVFLSACASQVFAQSSGETNVGPRGPVQFIMPRPGIPPARGSGAVKERSVEALRNLSVVRLVFDRSFAERFPSDLAELTANAERQLRAAGLEVIKSDGGSPETAVPTLSAELQKIKEYDNESIFLVNLALVENVSSPRDPSTSTEVISWRGGVQLTLQGSETVKLGAFVRQALVASLDQLVRDRATANKK